MTAKPGKDLLLKIGDGQSPENFSTVAGLRTRTLSLNAQSVDVTHSDSTGGWRELLAGAGVRQASASGAGVFLDDATAEEIKNVFFASDIRNWQIIIPDFGTIKGPFQLANLDYGGEYDGEVSVAMALESAGALTFTGAA